MSKQFLNQHWKEYCTNHKDFKTIASTNSAGPDQTAPFFRSSVIEACTVVSQLTDS